MTTKSVIPDEISVEDFARIIGVTPRTVRNYISEGVVTSGARGKIRLNPSIRDLIDAARKNRPDSQLDRARARALDARTKAQELKLAREQGEVIAYDDAEALVEDLVGLFVSHIESVPPRFTRDMKVRLELEKTVFDVRNDFVEAVRKRREELQKEIKHER